VQQDNNRLILPGMPLGEQSADSFKGSEAYRQTRRRGEIRADDQPSAALVGSPDKGALDDVREPLMVEADCSRIAE
jgi:hypothetical protein